MPELGARSPKAVAALAGVAPLARESGQKIRSRIRGGRPRVRRALLGSDGRHPNLSALHQRLHEHRRQVRLQEAGHHRRRPHASRLAQRHDPRSKMLRMTQLLVLGSSFARFIIATPRFRSGHWFLLPITRYPTRLRRSGVRVVGKTGGHSIAHLFSYMRPRGRPSGTPVKKRFATALTPRNLPDNGGLRAPQGSSESDFKGLAG